jgi:transcription-repair coupling factor (superfamily II helicase)
MPSLTKPAGPQPARRPIPHGAHGPRRSPETPPLPRLAPRHARGRPDDRRLLRRAFMAAGARRRWTGSRRCSRSRTSTSWPGRSEPPAAGALPGRDDEPLQRLDYIKHRRISDRLRRSSGRQADDPGRRADGFLPWLAADLARAAKGRARVHRARRGGDAGDRDAAPSFAPELEVLTFPAWDCLPYDRSSPSLRSSSERLATLHALQRKRDKPQLLVTTVNAATQRTLTPFRVRQLVARARARRADRPRPAGAPCSANGYVRAPTRRTTPANMRCAAASSTCSRRRGARRCGSTSSATRSRACAASIPPPAHHRHVRGLHPPARLRDPARRGQHQALPLALPRAVRRHRDRRSALPGGVGRAAPGRHRPLAAACSRSGWRPCSTISATRRHRRPRRRRDRRRRRALRGDRRLLRQPRARAVERARQLPAARAGDALPAARGVGAAIADRPLHLATPFHEPESATRHLDFERRGARDFAPERAQNANVYEAVVEHVAALRARQSARSCWPAIPRRARAAEGLLADHG